jgi:UDP-glucose 4-epimerase
MNFLVTGGVGFIGSHLVETLHTQGHRVVIIDDLSTGKRANARTPSELVIVDINETSVVADCMQGMDGCFHLAAIASVERCTNDWIGSHRTNLTGAISVFDVARRFKVPVVFASSAAVYCEATDMPLRETVAPNPISAYGADKFGCELHAAVAGRIHDVVYRGLRFFNVYGPRQDPKSPYSGVITIFANRLLAQEHIRINGDGSNQRDYIFVEDVVAGLVLAMEDCLRSGKANNGAYNICTGIGTSTLRLADEFGLLLGKPSIHFVDPRPGDPMASIGDPVKAYRDLGFRSKTTLQVGLGKTLAAITAELARVF